jgi:hypothetical protein
MRSLSFILVFIGCLGCGVGATRAIDADACSALASAESFSFGLCVYAGKVVSGEHAFYEILQRPDAGSCFEKIMQTGTIEGQMYALVALRELEPDRFRIDLKRLKERHFSVTVAATKELGSFGHSGGDDVLAMIERGTYRRWFEFYRTHKLPPKRD